MARGHCVQGVSVGDRVDPALLDIPTLQARLREFAAERDWDQFHSPKNLTMALAGEAGELLEVFQWLTEAQSREPMDEDRARAAEEIADIQIYLLRLADILEISIPVETVAKIQQNERRYPIELSRGNAKKRRGEG
jgi:dCTP diphosphatase